MRLLLIPTVLLTLVGCQRPPTPNVLLITFDTTRADRIGAYGNSKIQTPALDALADSGVLFDRAMAAVPITAPSHSTIMTGKYPLAHGVRDNGLFVLSDENKTLAEILKEEGYATAAAVGAYPVISRFGFSQGFDLFDDNLTGHLEDYLGERGPKQRMFFDERRAAQVNEAVMPWLNDHKDEPFFLWVHYFDPHQPFEPPPPYDRLYADDLYNGEIAYADSRIGHLLDYLKEIGVMDNTLVVMTADHGEGLGEHNEVTHAMLAYDSTLRVPLIIRPPGGVAPKVVQERVATVDILPTVLDLLGIETPDTVNGRSLRPYWSDAGVQPPDRQIYAENLSPRLSHGWGELRVLYDGDYKYIHGPRPELYDLSTDPDEISDLIGDLPQIAENLKEELEYFMFDHAEGVSSAQSVDSEVVARLQSLGYLQGGAQDGHEIIEELRSDGIPPQDRVGDINVLSASKHLLFQSRPEDALVYTRKLVAGAPNSQSYLELHASALAGSGHLDEAWEILQRLSSAGDSTEMLAINVANYLFGNGDEAEAIDYLKSRAITSKSGRVHWFIALLVDRQGKSGAAREFLEEAVAIAPEFATARVDLAIRKARVGDYRGAEAEFVRALKDGPFSARGHFNYGAFLYGEGRQREAARHFRRAADLAPRYLRAYVALVTVYTELGELDLASGVVDTLGRIAPDSEELAEARGLMGGPFQGQM